MIVGLGVGLMIVSFFTAVTIFHKWGCGEPVGRHYAKILVGLFLIACVLLGYGVAA